MQSSQAIQKVIAVMVAGDAPGFTPAGMPKYASEHEQKLLQLREYVVRLCMQVSLFHPDNRVVAQALAYLKTIGLDAEGISADQEAQLLAVFGVEPGAPT